MLFAEDTPIFDDESTVFRDLSGRVTYRAAQSISYTNGEAREWLTCLSLYGVSEQRVKIGKEFSVIDGIVEAASPRAGSRTWRATHLGVRDVDSLSRALASIASGEHGRALYVRGATPGSDWDANQATRLKTSKTVVMPDGRAIPYRRGIDDSIPRFAYVADLDKVPNLRSIDPRRNPEAALAWLRSLLPPALASARCGYAWSSSTCVVSGSAPLAADVPPPYLSCHLIFWLSEALCERDLRTLVAASRDHTRWRLLEEGMPESEVPSRPLDPATTIANQPIFLMAPNFIGMADPLAEAGIPRRGMLDGVCDAVDVPAWRQDLEVLPRLARAYAVRVPVVREKKPRKRVLRPSVPVPTDVADPRVVAARRRMAFADANSRKFSMSEGNKISGYLLFAYVAVREVCAVLALRHPGGIPAGDRHDTALRISALLSFVCTTEDQLKRDFIKLTRGLLTQEWLDSEWWGSSAQQNLVARMATVKAGPNADNRLRYGRQSLIDWLEPTAEEAKLLGLVALGPQEVRDERRAARQAAWQQAKRAEAIEARGGRQRRSAGVAGPWVAEGISRTEYYRRHHAKVAVESARQAAAAAAAAQADAAQKAKEATIAAELEVAAARLAVIKSAREATPVYREWAIASEAADCPWDVDAPPTPPADLIAAQAAYDRVRPRRKLVW